MNEMNTVSSSGVLRMVDGKKYRGHLIAHETGAAFYVKKQAEPIVEFRYVKLNRLDNIRRGGTYSDVTVVLKGEANDGEKYTFELSKGLKIYDHINKYWTTKPPRIKSRADELRRLAELRGERIKTPRRHLFHRRHPNRSIWGDIGIYFVLLIMGIMMVFPLVFLVGSSLKPLDELFRFPPTVFAQHPSLDNFSDLFVTMGQSWVPFSRYMVNTVLITVAGTLGHLIIASMAAFVLAKYTFPGGKLFFALVTSGLMFSGYVTGIPNYLIMSKLGMIDTYWALILPAFAAPIGLFMMKQFMESIPTALIEAAHIDGASELKIFWNIVMPNVKPAWLTVIIFSVQSLWNTSASTVIYSESKKTLVFALQQIQEGGIARTGQTAAATVIIVSVPVIIFILSQSQILETMASSGIKD